MTGSWLRRGLHAATAGVLFAAPLLSWYEFRLIIWFIALMGFVVDGARILFPRFHRLLARLIPVFRPREAEGPSGAAWLWLGYALAALTPEVAATAGILVGALADPAASALGERFGSATRKSAQGSLAGLVVAAGTLSVLQVPWPAILVGSTVAMVVERWPGPFDDNLVIAPCVAVCTMPFV